MTHVRQQVRNKFTEILGTIPGSKVFPSRVHPLSKEDMPCYIVKSGSSIVEPAVKSRMQPALQKRWIETEVYVFARSNEKIEDTLDEMTAIVENKVFDDPTLGSVAAETILQNTESFIGGDPSAPMGACRMSFLSLVLTKEGSPETPIRN